jgi:hypothetical protein
MGSLSGSVLLTEELVSVDAPQDEAYHPKFANLPSSITTRSSYTRLLL